MPPKSPSYKNRGIQDEAVLGVLLVYADAGFLVVVLIIFQEKHQKLSRLGRDLLL